MWEPWQVINCGSPSEIQTFWQKRFSTFLPDHKGKATNSVSHPFIPRTLSQWSILNAPENQNRSPFLRHETEGVESNFAPLSTSLCPCCLSTSTHCCPFISFTLSPGPVFGHCLLPFVHNVRLFMFHSYLLPCLLYFLLPSLVFQM